MFNAVLFYRADDAAPVYIVPKHIVKLEPLKQQQFVTKIITVVGAPETVEGSPSEVSQRLRRGQ